MATVLKQVWVINKNASMLSTAVWQFKLIKVSRYKLAAKFCSSNDDAQPVRFVPKKLLVSDGGKPPIPSTKPKKISNSNNSSTDCEKLEGVEIWERNRLSDDQLIGGLHEEGILLTDKGNGLGYESQSRRTRRNLRDITTKTSFKSQTILKENQTTKPRNEVMVRSVKKPRVRQVSAENQASSVSRETMLGYLKLGNGKPLLRESEVHEELFSADQDTDEDSLETFTQDPDQRQKAIGVVLKLIERRSYSKAELINKLRLRGFSEELAEMAVGKLEERFQPVSHHPSLTPLPILADRTAFTFMNDHFLLSCSGIVNDAKYAEGFARSRFQTYTWGPQRIQNELKRRGILQRDVENAIESAFGSETNEEDESDDDIPPGFSRDSWQKLCAEAGKNWTRKSNQNDVSGRKRRFVGWVQRRGYGWSIVEKLLRKLEHNG